MVLSLDELDLQCDVTGINKMMSSAAARGDIEKLVLIKEFRDGVVGIAVKKGGERIARLCKRWEVSGYIEALCIATGNGHHEAGKLIIEWGAPVFNEKMIEAAACGNTKTVSMFKSYGANAYKESLYAAARENHVGIMKMCKNWMGQVDINTVKRLLWEADSGGHDAVAHLCKEWMGIERYPMINTKHTKSRVKSVNAPKCGAKKDAIVSISVVASQSAAPLSK